MPPRRDLIIVNPRAGRGRAIEASWRVERLYREAGLEHSIVRTGGPGEAVVLARGAAPEFAAIVALGGDGTLHEVANGLADAATRAGDPGKVAALASIPIGTGNDFVKTLGIAPTVDAGFAVVRAGLRRRIDLGRAGPLRRPGSDGTAPFEREWFANDFSVGYAALVVRDMVDRPFYVRYLGGHLAYLAAGLRRVFYRPRILALRLDGGAERRARYYEIHVGNGRFCGGGIQFTPRALLDDGFLDVTGLRDMPQARLVWTILSDVSHGALTPAPERGIDFDRARRIEIEGPTPLVAYVDGESREAVPPLGERAPSRITVEVVPGAIDVLGP